MGGGSVVERGDCSPIFKYLHNAAHFFWQLAPDNALSQPWLRPKQEIPSQVRGSVCICRESMNARDSSALKPPWCAELNIVCHALGQKGPVKAMQGLADGGGLQMPSHHTGDWCDYCNKYQDGADDSDLCYTASEAEKSHNLILIVSCRYSYRPVRLRNPACIRHC